MNSPTGRQKRSADEPEQINARADWNAHSCDERHPTRQRFFNTLISLRVAIEDFEATMAGLVLSSYFAGFTLAALRCGRIIERVGHIRAYAVFAGMVVAATAAMPLLLGPLS